MKRFTPLLAAALLATTLFANPAVASDSHSSSIVNCQAPTTENFPAACGAAISYVGHACSNGAKEWRVRLRARAYGPYNTDFALITRRSLQAWWGPLSDQDHYEESNADFLLFANAGWDTLKGHRMGPATNLQNLVVGLDQLSWQGVSGVQVKAVAVCVWATL